MALKFKNVCITYRPHSDKTFALATEAASWLNRNKINVYLNPDLKTIPGTKKISTQKQINNLDLALVIGGDGTFLRAVRMLGGANIPLLGVNMGNLGFLTESSSDEMFEVLKLAFTNKLKKSYRTTLLSTVTSATGVKHQRIALNDIVIERGSNSQLIDITISSHKHLVSNVRADGLIIATPTGSTAYCLAAGGPIVHPNVKAITITPICPHTLTNRPLILSEDEKIELKLNDPAHSATMMIDGQRSSNLSASDSLVITKGPKPVVLLSHPTRDYFDILRAKLQFGKRE